MPPTPLVRRKRDDRCRRLEQLQHLEYKVYSQNGEDGVTLSLLKILGLLNRYSLEFGVEDGTECNTRILRDYNFTTLSWDGFEVDESIGLYKEFISYDTIINTFEKYNVPKEFDLLSIDLDSIDFWILLRILSAGYRPRIMVVEINPTLGIKDGDLYTHSQFASINQLPLVIDHPLSSQFMQLVDGRTDLLLYDYSSFSGTNYYGANSMAYKKLGAMFGYELVYCERTGTNCFLVLKKALQDACPSLEEEEEEGYSLDDLLPFVPLPAYGPRKLGHAKDISNKMLIKITASLWDLIRDSSAASRVLTAADVLPFRLNTSTIMSSLLTKFPGSTTFLHQQRNK